MLTHSGGTCMMSPVKAFSFSSTSSLVMCSRKCMKTWLTERQTVKEKAKFADYPAVSMDLKDRIYQNLSPESRCRWHQECQLLFQTLQRQRISEKHTACVTFVSHQVHPQLTSYRNHSCICHRRHLKFTRRSGLFRSCIVYMLHNVLINRFACILVPKKKCFSTHAEVCVVVSNSSLVPVRSVTMKAGIDTMLEVHGGKDFTVTQTKGRVVLFGTCQCASAKPTCLASSRWRHTVESEPGCARQHAQ